MAGAETSHPTDQPVKGIPAAVDDSLNAYRAAAPMDSTTVPAKNPIDSTGAISFPSLSGLESSLTKAANAGMTGLSQAGDHVLGNLGDVLAGHATAGQMLELAGEAALVGAVVGAVGALGGSLLSTRLQELALLLRRH